MELDKNKSLSDKLWIFILIPLVAAGVLGVGGTGIVWYRGGAIPSFLINAGPFLLVLVTLINIGLSGLAFLEGKKERRLTQDILNESRKDGVIETIVRSIEPLNERLEWDREDLCAPEGNHTSYKTLAFVGTPDYKTIRHVSYYYTNIIDDIGKYDDMKKEYNSNIIDLNETISNYIESGHLPDDILMHLPNHAHEDNVAANSDDLAHIVLTGEKPKSSKDWIWDNFEDIRKTMNELQDIDQFEEEFNEIGKLRRKLFNKNQQIQKKIDDAKSEYCEQYNIRNAEIEDRWEERQKEDEINRY